MFMLEHSTVGRAFALHAADPVLILPLLLESPASYWKYPARTAEPGKLLVAIFDMPKTVTTSLSMEMLLVPARAKRWATGWQWYSGIFFYATYWCHFFKKNKLFVCFAFWVILGDVQGLLLALYSGITPGGAQGTIWDAGNRTRVTSLQGKCPTRCAIAPATIKFDYKLDTANKVQ